MNYTVRQLRMLNEMSLAKMAELLNVTVVTYSNKENGKTKFYIDEAQKIADFFKKEIKEIMW